VDCEHRRTEPRLRRLSNGTEAVWAQCLDCGAGVRALPKRDYGPADLSRMATYDADLERAMWQQRIQEKRDATQKAREAERSEWFQHYDQYLNSPIWDHKRRQVLERDRWTCTAQLNGCRTRANQVHHLSYRHQGNEPLFDLTSVCAQCHEALHSMDKEKPESVA
jgi:5-methylcytosine-specific restriction endonuclease McrA